MTRTRVEACSVCLATGLDESVNIDEGGDVGLSEAALLRASRHLFFSPSASLRRSSGTALRSTAFSGTVKPSFHTSLKLDSTCLS